MSDDKCPKCDSGNVTIGAFPLSCQDCGWHFLNEHPCCVCSEPSVAACGAYGVSLHWCREHAPKSAEAMINEASKKAGPDRLRKTYEQFAKGGGW